MKSKMKEKKYMSSTPSSVWPNMGKEKVHVFHNFEGLTRYGKPCNSLTLWSKEELGESAAFQVKCLSEDNFMGSLGRQVRLLRTRDRFHSVGLTSLERRDFPNLLNILLMTNASSKICDSQGKNMTNHSTVGIWTLTGNKKYSKKSHQNRHVPSSLFLPFLSKALSGC